MSKLLLLWWLVIVVESQNRFDQISPKTQRIPFFFFSSHAHAHTVGHSFFSSEGSCCQLQRHLIDSIVKVYYLLYITYYVILDLCV